MDKLLRLPAVLAARGRRKSAHYDDIRAGVFPPPVAIGAWSVAWPESEVAAINSARIAGATDAEVRALVLQLVALRRGKA